MCETWHKPSLSSLVVLRTDPSSNACQQVCHHARGIADPAARLSLDTQTLTESHD